ncbi:MAG: ABC transporter ATP-binding protein [Candidatus Bathyarchaeota archaeon]|nr:ABC transporter ATP-binding protein [Candidatus Termiticorpusculum sp.]
MNNKNERNILEVQGLHKKYPLFTLNDITFNLPSGYIMGFVGPNGAGKTTTIKLLLNVIKGNSGNVKLFGQAGNVVQNKQIGVVMDTPMYVEDWTLRDVEKAISPFYSNWDKNKYTEYLKRFGLESKKKVKELSRGMKVKLQIAVALSHDANLLILDEPTSGLDPVARDEICDLLREFVSDETKGVLFSTHITADLDKTADYLTFILNGSIAFTGTKDELLEKYMRVTGGLHDLNTDQKGFVIGYREYSTGFEGMLETTNSSKLPKTIMIERITLDEIIIFLNKGVKL